MSLSELVGLQQEQLLCTTECIIVGSRYAMIAVVGPSSVCRQSVLWSLVVLPWEISHLLSLFANFFLASQVSVWSFWDPFKHRLCNSGFFHVVDVR